MTTLRRVLEVDADNPVEGDLYIDPSGQLVLVGQDATTRGLEVRQHVRDRLRFFLGEWFLDARRGFPYLRDVFIKNPNRQSIVSSLRRTVRDTPGVAVVDELRLAVASDRTATVDFRAILEEGGVLEFSGFVLGEF